MKGSMLFHLYSSLTAIPLLVFITLQASAQPDRDVTESDTDARVRLWEHYTMQFSGQSGVIENEEAVLLRKKWFYDMRRNADGVVDEQHRWNEFRRMRSANRIGPPVLPQWMSLGPNTIDSMSGRMLGHAFDPTDHRTIWAGSGSGGLWRTSNGGESWQSMTDELPSLYVSCVAIKPSDRNVMLIGTGVDRYNALALSFGVGVLKSTDRGASWDFTSFSFPVSAGVGTSKLTWHANDNNTVYLAASNGVWKSTNEGNTWTLLKSGSAATIIMNPQSPNYMYTPLRNDGIYRSTNGGTTWSRMENGLPTGGIVGLTSLALCKGFPSTLYAGITNSSTFDMLGLYKSTDSGNSWTLLPNAPNVYCYPAPNSTLCIGWANNVIGVSPVNPDLVILGGIRVFRTSNGGATWTWHDWTSNGIQYSNAGLTYVDQWDIAYDPVNSDTVYLFNDGGVQKSTNGGLWWNKKNNGLVTGQLFKLASAPSDTNLLIGGFQDHGLQRVNTAGGNTRWFRWSSGDGTFVIIHPTNTNVFYGDLFLAFHVKSTNGGMNWRTATVNINNGMTEPGQFFAPLLMHPVDPNTLYSAGLTKIFRTTNGGALWTPLATIPDVYSMVIDKQNPNILYAHAYTNTSWSVWRSTDAGAGWTQITHPSIPSWRVVDLKVDPSTSGTIYALRNSAFANQDHVKKSTDFGATWTNITANLPDVTMSAITISPYSPNQLYVATDLGVFATTNGGGDWFEFNNGLPLSYATDIHYHPLDRTLRLATLGRGVWKVKAMDAGIVVSVDVDAKWNAVSSPVKLYDTRVANAFPTATMPAFSYNGMYVEEDSLDSGKGYWIKFATDQTISLLGDPVLRDTVNLVPGWNLIGSISSSVLASTIGQNPPGLLLSSFYTYSSEGYQPASIISPGRAYWVKAGAWGHIIIGD